MTEFPKCGAKFGKSLMHLNVHKSSPRCKISC